MGTITIYGATDDLIEIEGAIKEEFGLVADDDEGDLLAFSDGTVLRVAFATSGTWRITPVKKGNGTYVKAFEAVDSESANYSDVVTIEADWAGGWVVHGMAIAF